MKKSPLLIFLLLVLPRIILRADVELPAIFSDHMVLEKAHSVPVWGKANPREEVTVTFEGQTIKATAGADGKWKTSLNLASSGQGPFSMTVQGRNTITISDVLVGEVWVASGQSNMAAQLKSTSDAELEIAQSANPELRQFVVEKAAFPVPMDDCEGKWVAASPETSGSFSAVGYYFGKALQNDLQVPVGIINTSWGGTPSEAWTSGPGLESIPDLKAAKQTMDARIADHPQEQKKWALAFGDWLKANGRQDKPVADPAKFAAPEASLEAWQKVKIPGTLATDQFRGEGAVWVRTEIEVKEPVTGALAMDLGAIEGFDSVYWNGELLLNLDYRNYPGTGYLRAREKYGVPAEKVKLGKNTLAIRIYAPSGPARFPTAPRIHGKSAAGEWLAREEFPLLPLTSAQLAGMPKPPGALPVVKHTARYLFNGMINPLVPYAISGVIWYQGESNADRAHQYRTAFPLLIKDWRAAWNQGEFPFYFCQLANYQPKKPVPGDSTWAELREAQSMALSLPATGQAVLIDIGESGDIHPRNKKDVGERIAAIALAKDYGKKIPFSGPAFQSAEFADGKAKISFTHTDGGLVAQPVPATYTVSSKEKKTAPTPRNSPKGELEGFAICGVDQQWVWADAKVDGDQVVVWSDKIPAPVAVRYGWADNPTVNLYNGAGLPASPFRTDDFPPITLNKKYEP